MRDIAIVTEQDLRAAVPLDLEAVGVIEDAFAALATKAVEMPPILSMEIPDANGEVDVKTAYIPGVPSFAIKISPGFFDNPSLGLPSLSGIMVLFSAKTGLVDAVLLDNGYLTDLRTAAAGAVAAKHLAPAEVKTAGVFGTGQQARLQMQALHLVRPFERVLVWGRDEAKASACAADLAKALNVEAKALTDPAEVAGEAQAVVTTTPSAEPIFKADWLHPGLHITAMGSDQPGKSEIDPRALALADLFVCDRKSQSLAQGELRAAIAAGAVDESLPVTELGEIIAGQHPGRPSEEAVTICDLTGTGIQDTAIATHAFAKASRAGSGTVIKA